MYYTALCYVPHYDIVDHGSIRSPEFGFPSVAPPRGLGFGKPLKLPVSAPRRDTTCFLAPAEVSASCSELRLGASGLSRPLFRQAPVMIDRTFNMVQQPGKEYPTTY